MSATASGIVGLLAGVDFKRRSHYSRMASKSASAMFARPARAVVTSTTGPGSSSR